MADKIIFAKYLNIGQQFVEMVQTDRGYRGVHPYIVYTLVAPLKATYGGGVATLSETTIVKIVK
jgi:hypothetical protein